VRRHGEWEGGFLRVFGGVAFDCSALADGHVLGIFLGVQMFSSSVWRTAKRATSVSHTLMLRIGLVFSAQASSSSYST
jgi:hypothetical protein